MTPLERSQLENLERAIDWTVEGMKRNKPSVIRWPTKDTKCICELCSPELHE